MVCNLSYYVTAHVPELLREIHNHIYIALLKQ